MTLDKSNIDFLNLAEIITQLKLYFSHSTYAIFLKNKRTQSLIFNFLRVFEKKQNIVLQNFVIFQEAILVHIRKALSSIGTQTAMIMVLKPFCHTVSTIIKARE